MNDVVASKITFSPKNQFGIKMYFSKETPKYSVIFDDELHRYFIRIRENDSWEYPAWDGVDGGFRTLKDAQQFLAMHDWENADSLHIKPDKEYAQHRLSEFKDAMNMLGMEKSSDPVYSDEDVYVSHITTESGVYLDVRVIYYTDTIAVDYWVDGKRLPNYAKPPDTTDIARTIRNIEKMMAKYGHTIVANTILTDTKHRQSIMAASTKDLAKDMVKVRSSNIWSYKLNIKNRRDKSGDLLVQFKDSNGGPGDLYIYYDVPTMVYRRWQSATSKGHYFWVYIRNNYKYSKLTGDKRGKLHNAIN